MEALTRPRDINFSMKVKIF